MYVYFRWLVWITDITPEILCCEKIFLTIAFWTNKFEILLRVINNKIVIYIHDSANKIWVKVQDIYMKNELTFLLGSTWVGAMFSCSKF